MKRFYKKKFHSKNVFISAPPRLEFDSRYLEMRIPIGGNIKINVNVDGEPTPSLVWTRNGMPLKGYRNVMVDMDEFTSSVVVKRASREDSGEYHVLAKNQWGTAEATFLVAVQGSYSNIMRILIPRKIRPHYELYSYPQSINVTI